jgi:hypothetical protein
VIVLDVNVVLAAFRQDHPHHERTRPWFERLLRDEDDVIVPDVVWVGFIRLVTNRRVFEVPSTLREAFAFVDAVCAASAYHRVAGLVDGLGVFRDVSVGSDSSANLVPDAYIASVALSHGCPVGSFDRDFRRFDALEIVVPG